MIRILTFSIILLLFACKPSFTSTENQKLYDEVMHIHDEVMPKMGEISKTRKALKKKLRETDLTDSLKQVYVQTVDELNAADDGMMNWMSEFKRDYDQDTEENIKKYLTEQKDIIQKVSDDMLSSIAKGKKLVGDE